MGFWRSGTEGEQNLLIPTKSSIARARQHAALEPRAALSSKKVFFKIQWKGKFRVFRVICGSLIVNAAPFPTQLFRTLFIFIFSEAPPSPTFYFGQHIPCGRGGSNQTTHTKLQLSSQDELFRSKSTKFIFQSKIHVVS